MAANIRTLTVSSQPHSHSYNYGQLIFTLEGGFDIDIAATRHQLRLGQGCLIPRGQPHSYRASSPCQILIIDAPSYWSERHNPNNLLNGQIPKLFNRSRVFDIDKGLQQLITFCLDEMAQRELAESFRQQLVNTLVQALASRLFAPPRHPGRIDSAKLDSYLEEHLAKPITVAHLAEQFFISESQFYKCFVEQFEMTPKQYITSVKMTRAKMLLKGTDKSIQELSFALGFQHQSCFTRSYKRFFGMSPKHYRQQCA